MNNMVGQSLGRYHIIEQLGEGGMAVVYKAFDTRLERNVAIKIIRRDAFPPEQLEQALRRFEREAKALARLSHPNIVKVLDYGEFEGSPYLVLEYLPGGTLKERMGHAFPWQEAVRMLLPVAHALAAAHEQGIIHRDMKPSNILMTQSGEPLLTDFGIAKILDTSEGRTLTASGVGIGTPDYMAPEQGMGSKVDARADVYSLGIVFYELVTGRKPYVADTPMAIVLKHMTDPLPRPVKFVPDLPGFVENVIIKALAKAPDDRYASMNELVLTFEKLLVEATLLFPQMAEKAPALPEEESPLKILPTDTGPDSIPTQPPSAPAEETKQTMGQQRAKRLAPSLLKTGLGIVILVALGVAGWLASRSLPLPTFNATPTLHLSTQPGQFATSCENDREKLCIRDYSGAMLQSIQLPLSDEFGNIDGLSWGPDGHQLVLAIGRGESTKTDNSLFIYDLETNQIQRLTNSPSNDVQPAWSPDGKWIAYHSSGRAILISPDSGQQKQLAREYESRFMANNFAWSPDSEWLAWLAREPTEVQTLRGLMLVAMKNFSVTFIPYAPGGDTAQVEYNLAWDPYGQFLYLQAWNQQAIHFDMSCLKTSCQGLTPEQADGNIPREWAQDYYPQWGLEVP